MSRSEIIKFLVLRSIGNFLLLFAIFGVLATFGPTMFYELQFRVAQARGVTYTIADVGLANADEDTGFAALLKEEREKRHKPAAQQAADGFAAALSGPKEQVLVPLNTNFGLVIPKIGANARVVPNVDPSSEDTFLPALKQGVAHAKGSVFPGQPGNIYLFAHSTDNFWDVGRYNAIFYLLKDVAVGDQIVVFFENVRYNYTVTGTKIVDATDVSYLNNTRTGDETLILQTCWPPGTTWKRLLVFAKRQK